jgi:hypothetical protein
LAAGPERADEGGGPTPGWLEERSFKIELETRAGRRDAVKSRCPRQMIWNGIAQSLSGWTLVALFGLVSKPDPGALSRPGIDAGWHAVDFTTATCGYAAEIPLTFSIPPGYIVRNPRLGSEAGCFWGMSDDLDRAFVSPTRIDLGKLDHGVFQARVTENVGYDPSRRKFSEEDDAPKILAGAGMTGASVSHLSIAGHPALVITARRPDGLDLYMLYIARGSDKDVVLVSYRPATPPTPADSANWRRFLGEIR